MGEDVSEAIGQQPQEDWKGSPEYHTLHCNDQTNADNTGQGEDGYVVQWIVDGYKAIITHSQQDP